MNRPSSVTCSHIFISFVSHISIWHKASWGLCGLYLIKMQFWFFFIQSALSFSPQVVWIYFPFSLVAYFILYLFLHPQYKYFMSTAPPISSEAAAAVQRCVCPFTSSLWLRPFSHPLVHTHTHSASEGSGKVRYSDEVCSKNTSCFPGKAASEKVAVCSLTT